MAGKNTVGNLAVIISGNAAPYIATMARAKQETAAFAKQISSVRESSGAGAMDKAGGLMQGMVGGFAAGAAMAGVSMLKDGFVSLTKSMIETAAQSELTQASFEVLTGSAESGQKLFRDIQDLAIRTPFDSAGLAENAKMMMGMGVQTEAIIPALSRLGDVAMGDKNKLQSLALVFGQVKAAGKLTGGDMLQFTAAGFGIEDFAKSAGKSVPEFRKLMEEGAISANMVTNAINDVTSAGGRFYGMNDRASKTVTGQWNALTESLERAKAEAGLSIFNALGLGDMLGQGADLLAPLKNVAAQMEVPLTHLRAIGGDVFQMLRSGAAAFRDAFAGADSVLGEFVPTWDEVRGAARFAIRETISHTGKMTDAIVKLGGLFAENLLEPLTAIAATVGDVTRSMLNAAAAGIDAIARMKAASAGPVGQMIFRKDPNAELLRSMANEINTTSMIDRMARVKDKLIEAAAKTDIAGQWLEGFDRVESRTESFITRMATALEKMRLIPEDWAPPGDVTAFSTKIRDAMKEGLSPKAIFDEHIRLINQAAQFGPENGGLNRKQVDFAFAKTVDDLEKAVSMGGQKFASSMLKGTQAAQSTINRAMFQRNANPQKRVENLLEQANRLAKLNEQHTKDTADAIRKLQIQGVGF